MTVLSKLSLACLMVLGMVMVARHGATALRPELPHDMPGGSYFVQSGYDLDHNEPRGEWIACHDDAADGSDFCRVTDAHGAVIYQGEFLTVEGAARVPASQLQVAGGAQRDLWVQGPAEAGPVPVIKLTSGQVLVPRDDTAALAERWQQNPEELRRVSGE